MNWTITPILAAVVAVFFWMKKAGQISPQEARTYLKKGALLIDVRSPGEFKAGHLPSAINIPLGEIETALPRRTHDKNQVLLLHCQSGMRSSAAVTKLKRMGYANAFNLGSYGRAKSILKQAE